MGTTKSLYGFISQAMTVFSSGGCVRTSGPVVSEKMKWKNFLLLFPLVNSKPNSANGNPFVFNFSLNSAYFSVFFTVQFLYFVSLCSFGIQGSIYPRLCLHWGLLLLFLCSHPKLNLLFHLKPLPSNIYFPFFSNPIFISPTAITLFKSLLFLLMLFLQ